MRCLHTIWWSASVPIVYVVFQPSVAGNVSLSLLRIQSKSLSVP